MKVLHLDSSGRAGFGGIAPHGPYGSYSRRLSQHFVQAWQNLDGNTIIKYRDLGLYPPTPVDQSWIEGAFSRQELNDTQANKMSESDELIEELLWADIVVIGAPMYNFNVPANLKAWVDNIVRVRKTLVADPEDPSNPYSPVFKNRRVPVMLLTARGDHGMDEDGEFAHINHLDPSMRTALGYIGLNEVYSIAIEYTAVGGAELDQSIEQALSQATQRAEQLFQELA